MSVRVDGQEKGINWPIPEIHTTEIETFSRNKKNI